MYNCFFLLASLIESIKRTDSHSTFLPSLARREFTSGVDVPMIKVSPADLLPRSTSKCKQTGDSFVYTLNIVGRGRKRRKERAGARMGDRYDQQVEWEFLSDGNDSLMFQPALVRLARIAD